MLKENRSASPNLRINKKLNPIRNSLIKIK